MANGVSRRFLLLIGLASCRGFHASADVDGRGDAKVINVLVGNTNLPQGDHDHDAHGEDRKPLVRMEAKSGESVPAEDSPKLLEGSNRDVSDDVHAHRGKAGQVGKHTSPIGYDPMDEDEAGEPNATGLAAARQAHRVHFVQYKAPTRPTEPPPRIVYLDPEAVSGVAPEVLFLLLGFITTLFYFVHSKSLRKITWEGLTQGSSIFLALTVFYLLKDLTDLLVKTHRAAGDEPMGGSSFIGLASAGGGDPPSEGMVLIAFIRMVVVLITVEVMMYLFRGVKDPMLVCSLIGPHVVGFLSADAFGTMQETAPWNTSAGMSFVIVLITFVFWWVNIRLIGFIRSKMVGTSEDDDVEERKAMHKWQHLVEHAENEATAFSLGLLITQTVRFAITGKMHHMHGVQRWTNVSHINNLFMFSLCLVCFIYIMSRITLQIRLYKLHPKYRRFFQLMMTTGCYTMAWTLLYWGRWRFWYSTVNKGLLGGGDIMTGQLVMAICFSCVMAIIIYVLYRIRQNMLGEAEDVEPSSLESDSEEEGHTDSGHHESHGTSAADAKKQAEHKVADMVTKSNKFALESIITALFVLVGLSWETCFYTANYDIVDHAYQDYRTKAFVRAVLGGGMCMVLAPAWVWYIIPKGFHGTGERTADDRWRMLRNAHFAVSEIRSMGSMPRQERSMGREPSAAARSDPAPAT